MLTRLVLAAALWLLASGNARAADITAVVDNTSYNAGSTVQIRLHPGVAARASIRYAGAGTVAANIAIQAKDGYTALWPIPDDAKAGRYEVDLMNADGTTRRNAASFAVYRQFAKVISAQLDRTFYTSGDMLQARIVVHNLSSKRLDHLRVEFEPYTYPWIAPEPDEPPLPIHVVADDLSLAPEAEKEFVVKDAARVQAKDKPVADYYSVVIRDSRQADRIYDLAFTTPVFVSPPNTIAPKDYPFLFLYQRLSQVPKSEAYRHFYPADFVSSVISFDASHTMFAASASPAFSYAIKKPADVEWPEANIETRVLDATGDEVLKQDVSGPVEGPHRLTLQPLKQGRYVLEVLIRAGKNITVARNRLEFAVNSLPKSILIFCAHQDDETDHPAMIRAAVENNIPVHFVYFTSGDAGGCDRYYMHSCDAARAMDFGETRMEETRASLAHLGVPREDIFFLGLPDGGLEQIWKKHLTAKDPYLSVLLATDHAPYREAAIPNLPYARESMIEAAEEFISRYQPELIVTGHPDERHVDHRTNNWIVVKAMQELLKRKKIAPDTQITTDIAYGAGPQKHAPYKYRKEVLDMPGEIARMAQEARWYYQSQDGNHQQADLSDYSKLPREEIHYRILDWKEHEGWNE